MRRFGLSAAWALAACALAGCAGTSGIIPVGPDTYTVSEMRAPAVGGGPAARQAVVAEADAFCGRQGRVALNLGLRPDGDPGTPFWPTAFDMLFRCTVR